MRARVGFAAFVVGGLAVALFLAFVVSSEASSQPDGLNRVAIDQGFAGAEREHATADLPTAGYAVEGVRNERLSTGLAGIIGVAATFAVAGGVTLVLRRTRRAGGPSAAPG